MKTSEKTKRVALFQKMRGILFSKNFLYYISCLFIFFPSYNLSAKPNSDSDIYERGVELKISGDWEQALKIWWEGRNDLERDGLTDPIIGIAFIELATENYAGNYYGTACEMYFWGLSESNGGEHRFVIQEEFELIAPLLGEKEEKVWRASLERNDSIAKRIKKFWLERDPTPATPANERLLEHWERIAFARETFNKNSSTPYGTDDRGLIHVKYGEPDFKKISSFGRSGIELVRWIESPAARSDIRDVDRNPDYELWIYYGIGANESTFFLFGREAGIGSFGLRNGVEEFISEYAYLRDARNILQIMYYSELAGLDPFFEDRYYKLEEIWYRTETSSNYPVKRILNLFFHTNKAIDRTTPSHKYAAPEKSSYHDAISPIQITAQSLRFLDELNSPRNAIMVFANPQFKNLAASEDFKIPDYLLRHTLIIRDENLNEQDRITDFVVEELDYPFTFILSEVDSNASFSIATEAFAKKDFVSEYGEFAPPKKAKVLANGSAFLVSSPLLSTDMKTLELSDFILGVTIPETLDESKFLFPLIPGRKIWKKDKLKTYLEIYHLLPDEAGISHYSIDFQIAKLKEKSKKKKSEITITFEFDSLTSTSKENFDVDISKLSPGNYQLAAMVTDKVSGQQKTRNANFEIYN